jgi:tRNA threonylcarbamoyladenosine biosynthesis protein TsaB
LAPEPLTAQPLLLAIETATRVMSVALLDGERVIAEISSDDARVHSERLLPALDRLFELAGTRLDAVGAFAISIGPGSFTGLRIGLATLKALAFDETRPVAAVPTLAALCAAAVGAPRTVAALLDARRGEVYAAAVAAAGDPEPTLLPDSVFTPAELAAVLPPEAALVIGEDAAEAAARLLALRPDLRPLAPGVGSARAARVGRLGRALLVAGRVVPAAALVPRYVRRAEAEARRTGEPLEPDAKVPRAF